MVQISQRSVATIRYIILRKVKKVLEEVKHHSKGAQLGLNVKNVDGRPGIKGTFNYDSLAEMVEAADIRKVYIISQFIGAIFDYVVRT